MLYNRSSQQSQKVILSKSPIYTNKNNTNCNSQSLVLITPTQLITSDHSAPKPLNNPACSYSTSSPSPHFLLIFFLHYLIRLLFLPLRLLHRCDFLRKIKNADGVGASALGRVARGKGGPKDRLVPSVRHPEGSEHAPRAMLIKKTKR